MLKKFTIFTTSLLLFTSFVGAQGINDIEDDDLNIGGDIFSDFNEDVHAAQVQEDERFYQHGRFYSFNLALGLTTFDGNRGIAYEDNHPSYGISFNYFFNFNTSFVLGFEYSQHHFFIEQPVKAYTVEEPGAIQVNMFRAFMGYRYYVDTHDLGTALTFSNPYFIGRMEYWYTTNKFIDKDWANDSGGGFGFGFGFGLEFPIKLKESYLGVEFLFHTVNFHDKYTQDYAPTQTNPDGFGYSDLSGNAYSSMISYNLTW
jgi:hypothetical protein